MTTATKPARTPGLPKADTRHESIELWYEDNFGNLWSATAPEIVPTGKMRRDPDRATIAALVAALRDAVRYFEVKHVYKTAMTAEQVEREILHEPRIGCVEIGAHSANTLARFDLEQARAALAAAEGKA